MSEGSGAHQAESPPTPSSSPSRPFTADGRLFRLAAEAERIRLAPLFDPYVAVHASRIEPLPHQITAVYGEMLPRQPLRFLLADDPGAGKTIMAGLLIRELLIRGDLERCLVVAPGSLLEQWQDELESKFGFAFDLLTRERIEAAGAGGNPFTPPPGRKRPPARGRALRDHPRPRPDPGARATGRLRRAGAGTLRAHLLREVEDRRPRLRS